jgi:peptidoglycan/xylan/chitin deacetylase (PgdA/CDA1 family)
MADDPSTPVGTSVVALRRPTTWTVLTYDDGPTPGVTDRLLPVLAETGATATFFVLLTRVRTSPGLLHEVMAAGHEIGLHGRDHRQLTDLEPATLPGLTRDAKAELEDVTGRPVRWFRPPYGAQSTAAWSAVRDAGMTPVLWSVTCRDWERLPQEEYLAGLEGRDLSGDIVLLHDGFADARDGVDDGTPPSLDRTALTRGVLERVGAGRLTALDLGRALESGEAERRPWLEERGDPA